MSIDYVVPMVFPQDELWRDDFRRTVGECKDEARWRSWGTERLLIKAVEKNLPFVRTIYILLARESQIQPWMRDCPKVRPVLHEEFIPNRHLPVFNSRAIEMYLHRVPGLSEYFIYGNDDMFPLSPLTAEDFFVDGLPCQQHTEIDVPILLNDFQYVCREELNMVGRLWGRTFTKTMLFGGHSLSALLKTTCEMAWSLFGKEMEQSVSQSGREEKNINQYIYAYLQYFSGEYVNRVPKRVFASINLPKERLVELIMKDDAGIVCINDNESEHDYKEYAAAVTSALEKKLGL